LIDYGPMTLSMFIETTRMRKPCADMLQRLALWLALVVFAPLAQAHGAHLQHEQHAYGAPSEHALATDLAAATLPCGGGGGSPCGCDRPCCVSLNPAKPPAISQHPIFPPGPIQHPRQRFVADTTTSTTSPIVAFAAPRAPPLPL